MCRLPAEARPDLGLAAEAPRGEGAWGPRDGPSWRTVVRGAGGRGGGQSEGGKQAADGGVRMTVQSALVAKTPGVLGGVLTYQDACGFCPETEFGGEARSGGKPSREIARAAGGPEEAARLRQKQNG